MNVSWSRTVPLEGEEGRRFLQRRVAAYSQYAGIASLVLVTVIAISAGQLPPLRELAVGVALLAVSTYARRFASSRAAVEVCDALASILVVGGYATVRSELLVLLIATNVLVGRSALVPSTGRRTLVVGVLALLPLVAMALVRELPRTQLVQVMGWSALAISVSTIVSRRIYGLTKSIEEARRLGQYTLEKKLGEGGMGEVYRARHAMLRRPTAVKLLPASRSSELDVTRFEREVQLTSQLTHPNTIQIYDFGRADDGTFYYAMEHLDGLTLEDLVRAHGAQPARRVARIVADVCGSLAEAHEAGLVHRDIKPQNIMLCARGGLLDVVKVLDFGLVRSVKHEESSTQVVGTPMYMAPEAVTSPDSLDARADLYALGAVAYFLLTGAPVFEAQTVVAVLAKHVHEPPAPLPNVPDALASLVMRCLAKEPAARPESARVLRDAMLAVKDGADVDLAAFWRDVRRVSSVVDADLTLTRTLLPAR